MKNEIIQRAALKWVRKGSNKKDVIRRVVVPDARIITSTPEVIFMAGSPGAGKTEISKNLNRYMVNDFEMSDYVRLDADELRIFLDDYSGKNAHLFQNHVSILMDDCISFVVKKKSTLSLTELYPIKQKPSRISVNSKKQALG